MKISITRNFETFGPFTIEQANSMLASGQLLPSDSAMTDGMNNWVPLKDVNGRKLTQWT